MSYGEIKMALSNFQYQCMLMFPKITKKFGGLRGDGAFGILNKCGRRWSIWLYPTADLAKEQLREWAESPSGCEMKNLHDGDRCMMRHEKILIKPDEEWMSRKFEESLMREPKAKTPNTNRPNKGDEYPAR
jgi:hypothetical protein